MNTLKVNLIANSLGQSYNTLLGLAMVPISLRYLGGEAYGLVAFNAVILSWSQLLDAGLSPVLARELARMRAGALSRNAAVQLIRSLEILFAIIGVVLVTLLAFGAPFISAHWLNPKLLESSEVAISVRLMGFMAALRLWFGIHRSGLVGLEAMIPLNIATCLVSTFRVAATIGMFLMGETRLAAFFSCQLLFTALEGVCLVVLLYRALPLSGLPARLGWEVLYELRSMSGDMGVMAGLWIVATQADRLFLSSALDLKSFGQFSIAAMLAGGIVLVGSPVIQVLQSRFVLLIASDRRDDFVRVYRLSSQLLSAAISAICGAMVFFPEKILWAWTRSDEVANSARGILSVYAVGNLCVVLLALAFALQFAHGRTRAHLWGSLIFTIVWVPLAYLAAKRMGGWGTGISWAIANASFLVLWIPAVQGRIERRLGWSWIIQDIGATVTIPFGIVWLCSHVALPQNRVAIVSIIIGIVFIAAALAAVAQPLCRTWLLGVFRIVPPPFRYGKSGC